MAYSIVEEYETDEVAVYFAKLFDVGILRHRFSIPRCIQKVNNELAHLLRLRLLCGCATRSQYLRKLL